MATSLLHLYDYRPVGLRQVGWLFISMSRIAYGFVGGILRSV